MSYVREILSLNQKGSLVPKIGIDGRYHVLYMTTCFLNDKVYVGAHTTSDYNDSYLGHGIYSIKDAVFKKNTGLLPSEIVKMGFDNFKRNNLLFFDTRDELFEFEREVVNEDFISRDDTLNICIGGKNPPVLYGKDNGNYGNKWSKAKREAASKYIKEFRRPYDGSNNPNAKKCLCINVVTFEEHRFDYLMEMANFIGIKHGTIASFFNRGHRIVKGKYVMFTEQVYNKIPNIAELIEECINNSRYKDKINKLRNDCKKH